MMNLHIHGLGVCAMGHDEEFSQEGLGRLEDVPIKPLAKPAVRRRYGRVTKLKYVAAHRALEEAGVEDPSSLAIVTGTAMGEVKTSLDLLSQIHARRGISLSPSLVPNSVHNAPAGHLTIGLKDKSPAITVSQGWLSGQAAVSAAADLVQMSGCSRVLVAFGDEADPTWLDSLREHGASQAARALAGERFQEGAMALVLGKNPGGANLGTLLAGVGRDPKGDAQWLDQVFGRGRPDGLELVLDEDPSLDSLADKFETQDVVRRTTNSQIGAALPLKERIRTREGQGRLLTVSKEVDDIGWFYWVR